MNKREAFNVLRRFDPLDEEALINLSREEIDHYCRAIEVAFDGVCGRPHQCERACRSGESGSSANGHRDHQHCPHELVTIATEPGSTT